MRNDRLWLVTTTVIALVAALLGGLLLAGAGGSATHRHVTVGGVPLDEVHPHDATGGPRRPGVVVAHGFAGSARLMAPFGDTLAASGYVVVLLDFAGHGADRRPLPDDAAGTDASTEELQHDLDVAITHLRGLPDVDPDRIALVGHSMGASAVTRYAGTHPVIKATVAISLPGLPPRLPERLLTLVGQLEFPGFRTVAEQAAKGVDTGRSAVVVPGVEHISILYAPRTHREMVSFLADSFGRPATDSPLPSPMRRVAGAGALLVALLVGLFPIGWLLLGGVRRNRPRFEPRRLVRTVPVAAAALAVASVTARWLPTDRLPQAIAGYLVGLTVVGGAAMLAYDRFRPAPPPAEPASRPATRRRALAAPILLGYAAVTIALPLNLGLTYALPTGDRRWLLPIVWAGFALLAYAGDRLSAGNPPGLLVVSAIAVAALTGAAVAGLVSGFVVLVVPPLAVLLLIQAAWAGVLHAFAAPRWLIAAMGALLVTWPISAALPLVGQ
ncbi:alpha/beta hydrolase [Actinoplanes subtropicus]|uniref:alpha/beta hydrolase n=1 Tax=Actinoplanes subtropicus TaxID=543632 RepID=UPI0004C423CC|nr:alpha/beta fold hydrolase [Actinoplanes subtropicus]